MMDEKKLEELLANSVYTVSPAGYIILRNIDDMVIGIHYKEIKGYVQTNHTYIGGRRINLDPDQFSVIYTTGGGVLVRASIDDIDKAIRLARQMHEGEINESKTDKRSRKFFNIA